MSKDTEGETDGLPYSPLGLFSAQELEDFMHSLLDIEIQPPDDVGILHLSSSSRVQSQQQLSFLLKENDPQLQEKGPSTLEDRGPSESPSSRMTEQSSNCTLPIISGQLSQKQKSQEPKVMPSLLPVPYFVPMAPLPFFTEWTMDTNILDPDQKVPLPILFPGDSIKYACAKQAERIHKLRVKRALGTLPVYTRDYNAKKLCYEKRSAHAKQRQRAKNGQFYSKNKQQPAKRIKRDTKLLSKKRSKEFRISLLRTSIIASEEQNEESQLPSLFQDISEIESSRESCFSLKIPFLDH